MSYTQAASTATCTLAVNAASEAITLLTDWLGNNPDEMPEGLSEDGTADDIAEELSPYIDMDEMGQIIVSFNTEGDDNYDSEVFDFITRHFASIQTSDYMVVNWSRNNSRDGVFSGTNYYDKNGNSLDMNDKSKDSKALDQIAAILSGKSWTPEDMELICEVIRDTGRVIEEV